MRQRTGLTALVFFGFLAAITIGGCGEEAPTGPGVTGLRLAKRAEGDPTVSATDPTGAPQDTTLDVEVTGSGFDDGSSVQLTLRGVPTDKVRTNFTRFRNARTLIANITVAPDAQIDFYDVEVMTARGKKGIGTEMFEVFYKVKGTPTETVDFLEPAVGESEDLFNLRSTAQSMWGERSGKKDELNLDMNPFSLTFAFSEADLDPSTWADVPDPETRAECEEVSRRLAMFQALPQPLVGAFSFLYMVGGSQSSTTVWFEVVVGDYRYLVRNWSCTTCLRDGQPILTISERPGAITFHVRGAGLEILRFHVDDPPGKRDPDPQACRAALLDYVLTVTE